MSDTTRWKRQTIDTLVLKAKDGAILATIRYRPTEGGKYLPDWAWKVGDGENETGGVKDSLYSAQRAARKALREVGTP